MARLQWEPLAIPDISSSAVAAQAAAGRSAQEAIAGLGGLVGQWEGARREDVLGDITRQQLTFSDPVAYRAALANGTIPLNSDYLRPEDMRAVAGYQDTLTSRRNAENEYTQGNIDFANRQTVFGRNTEEYDRNNVQREAMDSASRSLLDDMRIARQNGDRTAYSTALEAAVAANKDLSAAQIMQLDEAGDDAVGTYQRDQTYDLSRRRGEFGFDTEVTNQRQSQDDRFEGRNVAALQAVVTGIAGAAISDKAPGGGAELALQQAIATGTYTPREIAAVAQSLGISAPADIINQLAAERSFSGPTSPTGSGGVSSQSNVSLGGSGTGAVGDRNYNPGNVRDVGQFRGQPGYVGTDSRGFAQFSSPEAGANVAVNQLNLYMTGRSRNVPRGGIRTIDQIVKTWAPVGRENSAASVNNYVNYVARRLGVSSTAELSLEDAPRLAQALGEFENGRTQSGVIGRGDTAPRVGVQPGPITDRDTQVNALVTQIANPTSFIPAAESVMLRMTEGLARQGGTVGQASAAEYARTQAVGQIAPTVVAASALGQGGIFAGSGVEQGRLATAIQQLKDDVGGSLTSSTAARIISESTIRGPNLAGQMAGNVRALGGGVRVDMVQAAQIARALGGEGGANLRENAVNARRGQEQAAAMTTQYNNLMTRYQAGIRADEAGLGPGQLSPITRGYGEQLVSLLGRMDALAGTAQRNAQSFAEQNAPVAASRANAAGGPVTRTPVAPSAATPAQLGANRTARARANQTFGIINPLLPTIINSVQDQFDRLRR